jgi:hypothetical protein
MAMPQILVVEDPEEREKAERMASRSLFSTYRDAVEGLGEIWAESQREQRKLMLAGVEKGSKATEEEKNAVLDVALAGEGGLLKIKNSGLRKVLRQEMLDVFRRYRRNVSEQAEDLIYMPKEQKRVAELIDEIVVPSRPWFHGHRPEHMAKPGKDFSFAESRGAGEFGEPYVRSISARPSVAESFGSAREGTEKLQDALLRGMAKKQRDWSGWVSGQLQLPSPEGLGGLKEFYTLSWGEPLTSKIDRFDRLFVQPVRNKVMNIRNPFAARLLIDLGEDAPHRTILTSISGHPGTVGDERALKAAYVQTARDFDLPLEPMRDAEAVRSWLKSNIDKVDFNRVLVKNLQRAGYKGILRAPTGSYGEWELSALDPKIMKTLEWRKREALTEGQDRYWAQAAPSSGGDTPLNRWRQLESEATGSHFGDIWKTLKLEDFWPGRGRLTPEIETKFSQKQIYAAVKGYEAGKGLSWLEKELKDAGPLDIQQTVDMLYQAGKVDAAQSAVLEKALINKKGAKAPWKAKAAEEAKSVGMDNLSVDVMDEAAHKTWVKADPKLPESHQWLSKPWTTAAVEKFKALPLYAELKKTATSDEVVKVLDTIGTNWFHDLLSVGHAPEEVEKLLKLKVLYNNWVYAKGGSNETITDTAKQIFGAGFGLKDFEALEDIAVIGNATSMKQLVGELIENQGEFIK